MFKTLKVYWSHLSSAKDLVVLAGLAAATLGFFMVGQVTSAESGDCDNNAILRCGAYSISTLNTKYNSADAEARGAFNYYGISNDNEFGNMVEGAVTRDNTVVVNGQVVARNVRTAGRVQLSSSDTPIPGGAWARSPSVSFRQNSLSAFVYMKDGVFQYAVIKSCGNPVGGTPTTQPATVSIIQSKATAPVDGSQVVPGQTIAYQVAIKNISTVDATGATIADAIPANTTYKAGSLEVLGNTPQPDTTDFDGTRVLAAWNTLPAGAEYTIRFEVTVNGNVADGVQICNAASVIVTEIDESQDTNRVCHETDVPEEPADVQVCNPATGEIITVPADEADEYLPVDDEACADEEPLTAECTNLTASPRNGTSPLTTRFTATIDADEGVSVRAVVFDLDNGNSPFVNENTNGADPRVLQATFETGVYDVRVTEIRTNEGNFNVPSGECAVRITVEEEPEEEPDFACVSLRADPTAGRSPLDVILTATARAENTTIVGYAFDLNGDGRFTENELVRSSETTASIDHTFTTSETVRAVILTEAGQTDFTNDCKVDITIEDVPPAETLICSGLNREDIDEDTKKFIVTTSGDADVADNGYQFEVDGELLDRQSSNMLTRNFTEGDHTVRARVFFADDSTSFADCANEFTVDLPDEQPPEVNPPTLPDTGAANMISAVFGTTTLGQGVRMWLASRKKLASALLGA